MVKLGYFDAPFPSPKQFLDYLATAAPLILYHLCHCTGSNLVHHPYESALSKRVSVIVSIHSCHRYQSRNLHLQKHLQLFFTSFKAFICLLALTCIHSQKEPSTASSHAWITHLFEQSSKERTFSVLASVKEESLSQLWT